LIIDHLAARVCYLKWSNTPIVPILLALRHTTAVLCAFHLVHPHKPEEDRLVALNNEFNGIRSILRMAVWQLVGK
jgi:hypothetical protein